MPELILMKGSKIITRYRIVHHLVTIGRDEANEISLSEPSISSRHAQLFFDGKDYYLRDLDTTNGTKVNGRRITQQKLLGNEKIEIGTVCLKFIKDSQDETPLEKIKTNLRALKSVSERRRRENLIAELERDLSQVEEKITTQETVERNLKTLLEVGQHLSRIHSFPELFEAIIDLAIKTLGAERGLLLVKDKQGNLVPRVNRKMEEELKQAQETSISHTVVKQVTQTKEPCLISSTKQDRQFKETESIVLYGIQSILSVPILDYNQTLLGVIYLDTRTKYRPFSQQDLTLLTGFANQVAIALENELLREREKEAVARAVELEEKARYAEQIKKLEEENILLQKRVQESQFENIIGQDEKIQEVFSAIERVSKSKIDVLIEGETGTGKELVARAIHKRSSRAKEPFVVINCTAIPESLVESELFGYEKGAFTQAYSLKKGKFELADKGSVFLDEIADLPLSIQGKLLRVLEQREVERIGGRKPFKVDIRLISATNKNLEECVKQGKFREDLYYRLKVARIYLPPLRERGNDLYLLANYFLNKFSTELHRPIRGFSPEAWETLTQHSWPGNIRELQNRVKSAVVMTKNIYLSPDDLGFPEELVKLPSLKEAKEKLEAELVEKALSRYHGNITHTASALKIDRVALRKLIAKYQIKLPSDK